MLLYQVDNVVNAFFENGVSKVIFENTNLLNHINFRKFNISKSLFRQIIADVSYIESFEVEMATHQFKDSLITLYDTGIDTKELFQNIGINILSSRILDNQTVFLDENQAKILFEKASYLVAMETVNFSALSPEDFIKENKSNLLYIPSPSIEPIIGVIDTLFDNSVYFSEWVDYHEMVDEALPRCNEDYRHGTAVSSIIVDGPKLNPWLDDGCGRFRVRHFGVAVGAQFSSFTIIKQIKSIIIHTM